MPMEPYALGLVCYSYPFLTIHPRKKTKGMANRVYKQGGVTCMDSKL